MLDFLAEKAGYARAGHHGGGGGQWVDGHDLIAAQFLQHDSRDHDPQLHVHGPVANKVLCARRDGAGAGLHAVHPVARRRRRAAASGSPRRTLWQQLGAWWETRPDGKAREIVGVDPEESRLFSKRTAAITPTLEELVARFRAETGRAPTARERSALADQATLVTRRGKVFGGETRDGQLARWAAEYDARFGRDITALATRCIGNAPAEARAVVRARRRHPRPGRDGGLAAVVDPLEPDDGRLRRPARPPRHRTRTASLPLLEGLTDKAEALARHLNPQTGPRGSGRPVLPGGRGERVRQAARRPVRHRQPAARRAGAARGRGPPRRPHLDERAVDEVVARFARGGRPLGADQEAALRGILTSGAAVEILNAPAGTGKSFLVGALADTWPLTGEPMPAPPATGRPMTRMAGPRTARGCSGSPTGSGRPTCSPRKA